MKNQLTRIFYDKKKMGIVAILLILPSLEIILFLYDHFVYGFGLPTPLYATFLSLYSRIHILQSIYLWFLPLYFLLIIGEDCIEDFRTGYKNILICKIGKTNYIKNKLKSGFLIPFFILSCGLFLNLILVQIACHGGTEQLIYGKYMIYDAFQMPETLLFKLSYTHPLLTNIIYNFFTASFAGLIGIVGTSLSIVLHDRKLVYAITFALWFIPILFKHSFMLIFQPFSEYGFNVILPLTFCIAGFYSLLIVLLIIWEVKIVKI